jgi:putative SOS response-associated peptidase YedK
MLPPILSDPRSGHRWLASAAAATELLRPAPEMLQLWPVSRRVNRVGNENDPKLIEAIQ